MRGAMYLVHKPVGPTSFAVMRAFADTLADTRARAGAAKKLKVCHGGTLDPFASGLLLVLVGSATRLFDHLHAAPKVYEAAVRWGVETDNGDPLGRAVFQGDTSTLTPARLDEALAAQVGWREQVPPATSNKRVGGERAYARAHRGEVFELPAQRVYLHEARWVEHRNPSTTTSTPAAAATQIGASRLRLVVRGGYYVRALARDLGRLLGCGAHLSALHRVSIGPWADPGEGRTAEVTERDVLPWAGSRELTDQEVGALRKGEPISTGDVAEAEWRVPIGFPAPEAPVRGFHQGRLAFLLRAAEGGGMRVVAVL